MDEVDDDAEVVLEDTINVVDEVVADELALAVELEVVEATSDDVEEVLVVLTAAVVVYTNVEFEAPRYLAPQTLLAVEASPTAAFK